MYSLRDAVMIAPVVLAINFVPKLEVEVEVRSTTFSASSPRLCASPAGDDIDVEGMAVVLVFLVD